MTDPLFAAIARLAAFRSARKDGDLIDARSQLTTDDLDLILLHVHIETTEWSTIDPAIRELCC